jgi:hypothetical protein
MRPPRPVSVAGALASESFFGSCSLLRYTIQYSRQLAASRCSRRSPPASVAASLMRWGSELASPPAPPEGPPAARLGPRTCFPPHLPGVADVQKSLPPQCAVAASRRTAASSEARSGSSIFFYFEAQRRQSTRHIVRVIDRIPKDAGVLIVRDADDESSSPRKRIGRGGTLPLTTCPKPACLISGNRN